MGVYIKGMEKPRNCGECQFCHTQLFGTWCCIMGREDIFFDAVPDWCPLVEVRKPHGDLIDRDQLVLPSEDIGSKFAVKYAPAVIEAEGGD